VAIESSLRTAQLEKFLGLKKSSEARSDSIGRR
jgi:hypothetical protein